MKWQIDKKNKCLTLDKSYDISFDRLQEDNWFNHLAEKSWVNMDDLFNAFVAAYKAANLPLTKDFFAKFKLAYLRSVDGKFYSLIFDLRYVDEKRLFRKAEDFKSEQSLIEEIVD